MEIIDKQKELKEMRADERKVANDKLKYPKITGRTFAEAFKPVHHQEFDHARNDAMRLEASNPFN